MSRNDWQKKQRVEEVTEKPDEAHAATNAIAEAEEQTLAQRVTEVIRSGAEMEMPINGYSGGFISEKVKKLLGGDSAVMNVHTPQQREAIMIKALQLLSARLAKLEKDLGA